MSLDTDRLVWLIDDLLAASNSSLESSERVSTVLDEISQLAADMVASGQVRDIPSVKSTVEVLLRYPAQEHDVLLLMLTDIASSLFRVGSTDAADWLIARITDMLDGYVEVEGEVAPTKLAPIAWIADPLLALNLSIGNTSRQSRISKFASQPSTEQHASWVRHGHWHEEFRRLTGLDGTDGRKYLALYKEAPDDFHRALVAVVSKNSALVDELSDEMRTRITSGNLKGVARPASVLAPALRTAGRYQAAWELASAGLSDSTSKPTMSPGGSIIDDITEAALFLEMANIRIASVASSAQKQGSHPDMSLHSTEVSRLLRAAAARLLRWRSTSANPFVRAELPTKNWRRPLIAGLVSVNDVAATFTVVEAFHSAGVADVLQSNTELLKPEARSRLLHNEQGLEYPVPRYLICEPKEDDWISDSRSDFESSNHADLRTAVGELLAEAWRPELMTIAAVSDEIASGTAFLQGYDFSDRESFFGACVVSSAETAAAYLVSDPAMRDEWTNWRAWLQHRDEDRWGALSRALLPAGWVTGDSAVPERLVIVGSGAFAAAPWALLPVASGRLGEVTDLMNAPSIQLWKSLPAITVAGPRAVFVGLAGRHADSNQLPEASLEYAALKDAGFKIRLAGSFSEFRSLAPRSDLALFTIHGAPPSDRMNFLRFPNGDVVASPELLTVSMPPVAIIGSCWAGAIIDDPLPLNLVSSALIAGTRGLVVGVWPDAQSAAMSGAIRRLVDALSQGHTVAQALRHARNSLSPYERAAAAGLLAISGA